MLINPKHCALIFLLIGLINAGPLKRSEKSLLKGNIKCSKTCTDSKNFNYQIGRSYRYSFETKNSFTPETGNALNELKISGHAKITIQSNCEHILKLENVKIEGASSDQAKLVTELEEHTLAYSFQDGKITSVCPLSEEIGWTLNVKKAILSALQFAPQQVLADLSNSNVDEKDINGNCETTYEMQSSSADQYKVTKTKNLKTCSQRMNIDSTLIGSSSLAGDLANMYINSFVETDYRCKYTINKKTGIVDSSKCTQSSDGAKVVQKDLRTHHEISLKFSNEDPVHYAQLKGEYYEDSLHGERIQLDEDEVSGKNVQATELKSAVSDLCQTISTSTLNHQTATKFRDLVNKLKHSKDTVLRSELVRLLEQRNRAKTGKHHDQTMATSTCCPHKLFKLYLDALISTKTDESLKILVNEIVPNNFYLQEGSARAELKLISFYTSLAFYRHPTEETLKAALPLLELKGRHNRNALFGLTGLARTICKKEKKCDLAAVNNLANTIANRIPSNCDVKASNENVVIESLKALENLPKLPEPVLKKLVTCLSSNASPNVKVSVIKNFDDKTDNELVKKAIKDSLMNGSEQEEVRIQAYKRYKMLINKDNAKEIEKLITNKGELSSYIAHDIQRYRDDQTITCPKILALKEATSSIDLKLSSQQGRSKQIATRPLRLFFKSNLVVYTDVTYSPKTEKPISVISSFNLHHKEIVQIGLRSESGSNLLLNVANVETVVDGLMQLVKSFNAKQEDGKARLVDEWAARVFPELASAFKDVDLYVKVGGRNLIYLNKNDQSVAVSDRLDKLKLGLAPILAMEQSSDLQIHSVSGLPTLIRKEKTILSNFVLFDSEKVSDNEVKFEISPNLVLAQLLRISYPIGKRSHNNFVLENEEYMTTSFGLQGRRTDKSDKTEIRLKLTGQKVDLLSHRVYNRIRQGDAVKEVPSTKRNQDLCLENMLPIRKALGVSICSKYNDNEKSIVLQKTEDSNVLITMQKENTKTIMTIEQENSPHKRKISLSMSRDQPGSSTVHIEIDNPLGKAWAKVTTSKDKINMQAKMNDQQVYSLEAEKSYETKGKESNFKAKVSASFPGMNKPFVTAFTAKIVSDRKLQVSGELTVDEKTRLVAYDYSAEGKYSKAKRAVSDYSLKTDLDLQVFNMEGKKLLHSKYDADYKSSNVKMNHMIEYATSKKAEKHEKLNFESKIEWEYGAMQKMNVMHSLKSTQYPKLNFKYDQKFLYKYEHHKLEHYENDINMEIDALGTGDDRKVRFGHVSAMKNFYKGSKKSSMDHMIRIVINKVNYNREINYNGNYELVTDNIYEIDDKLKISDMSTSNEMLSASVSLKAVDKSKNDKLKLLVNYNCNKHGLFKWEEDINYDPKTKAVSTTIELTVSRSDQQTPTVHTKVNTRHLTFGHHRPSNLS